MLKTQVPTDPPPPPPPQPQGFHKSSTFPSSPPSLVGVQVLLVSEEVVAREAVLAAYLVVGGEASVQEEVLVAQEDDLSVCHRQSE